MRYVEIELGGKLKRLKYDFNAIASIEKESGGYSIAYLIQPERLGFYTIQLLLWAGLKHEDKGLTLERTGYMIQDYIDNGDDLEKLMASITEAFELSGLLGKINRGE